MAKDNIKDTKRLADASSITKMHKDVDSTETSKQTTQGQPEERREEDKYLADKMELGWIGKIWGGGKEKAGNIAGIAVSVSLLLLGAVIAVIVFSKMLDSSNIAVLREVFTVVTSILTLSLGYLFGQGSSQGNSRGR